MTFAQPLWLWLLALLPVLALLFLLNERRRARLLSQLVAARLADRLAGNVSVWRRRVRFLLLLLGLACATASLAQPRYGFTWQESKRRGRDILLAIDTSRSMLATDLLPNRLQRAKLAAQDLIDQLGGDRVGVIAFAGTSFLQAPLTADYGAVIASLQELDTEIIPQGGTNIADAIKAAEDAFGKGESDHRALVIFTDGEELDANGVTAAERVRESIRIFTIGVGSADGALIPVPRSGGGTEFVQDSSGQFVKSRLDEERLRKIAEATGGFYVRLLNGPAEMQQIVRDGLGAMTEKDIDAKLSRQPIERYQWPLGAALLFLATAMLLGERKRAARAALAPRIAAALLLCGTVAEARNTGLSAYEKEDYQGALDTFAKQLERRPGSEALHFNHGAAAYKAGEYDSALASFARAVLTPDPQLRAKAEYNIGNTLYQRGAAQKERDAKLQEWRGALQHYDEALKVDAKDENAAHNRDLVKRMIEELEKEQQQEQQQQQDKDKQKQDKQKQDKQDKQEQKDKGDQKDGEKQEQQSGEGKDGKPQSGEKKEEQQQGGEKGDEKDEKEGGEKPEPKPDPAGEKKEGEMQAAPQFEKEGPDPAEQEAADAQAASEGKMTEQQAKALLDSLKAEDDRVQLRTQTDRKRPERAFRDW